MAIKLPQMYRLITVNYLYCLGWGNGVNVHLLILAFQPYKMQATTCKNCNNTLQEDYKFCPHCSQATHTHRLTLGHLLHEAVHAFTHADKGILLLVKDLALNPGVVLREFIFEGKRKKYFNPFTFLLLVLGLSVFVNSILHPYVTEIKPSPEVLAQLKTPEQKKKYIHFLQKQESTNSFIEKKSNWVTLLSTPVYSFIFWLMYRRRKTNFAEHFVAYLFMIGFLILVSTFTLVPLMSWSKNTPYYLVVVGLNLIIQLAYFTWSYKTFLNLKSTSQILRATLASFLSILLWVVLSMVGMTVYLIWG
jgi:Protein of unknown function (DUF3667)